MIVDLIEIMNRGYDAKPAQEWPLWDTGLPLDRTDCVTASEIGTCARMVKFNKEAMVAGGYRPEVGTKNKSSDGWGFFERGHTMEEWAVQMIHAGLPPVEISGIDLIHTGKNQVSFKDGHQSGTPDGVYVMEDAGAIGILEIKSIDPRTNVKRNIPKMAHKDQVMQNLDLVSQATGLDPIGGDIIYIDASNYKQRYPFHFPWDVEHASRLETRASMIMNAATPADVKPEGLFNGGCQYCDFGAQCSAIVSQQRNEKGIDNALSNASSKLFR